MIVLNGKNEKIFRRSALALHLVEGNESACAEDYTFSESFSEGEWFCTFIVHYM